MKEILARIERQKLHFGEHMQPPCSEEEIRRVEAKVNGAFRVDVPESYVSFLRRTNGLEWNGTVFFGSGSTPLGDNSSSMVEGIFEANARLREVPGNSKFLVFGESGMEMYVMNLSTRSFDIVDHVSTDIYQSFKSFEELLQAAMEKRLLQGL